MKYLKVINAVLLLLQALTFPVVALILYAANTQFNAISENRYGVDSALMNNATLDFFTNPFFAIAVLIAGFFVCYKAWHVTDLKIKLSINSGAYLVYSLIGAWLIYHLYVF